VGTPLALEVGTKVLAGIHETQLILVTLHLSLSADIVASLPLSTCHHNDVSMGGLLQLRKQSVGTPAVH
jgi:hypothetical protein